MRPSEDFDKTGYAGYLPVEVLVLDELLDRQLLRGEGAAVHVAHGPLLNRLLPSPTKSTQIIPHNSAARKTQKQEEDEGEDERMRCDVIAGGGGHERKRVVSCSVRLSETKQTAN